MSERPKRAFDNTTAAQRRLFVDLLNGNSPPIPQPESLFLFPDRVVLSEGGTWENPVKVRAIRREARRNKGKGQTAADWEHFIQAIDAARLPCGPIRRAEEEPQQDRGNAIQVARLAEKRERAVRKATSVAQFQKDILKRLTRKAKQWQRKSLSVLQAGVSPFLWRCAICSKFFLATDGRKRLYCSEGCKNRIPKRDEMKDLRARGKKEKLVRASEALAAWNGRGDWKGFVAAKNAKTGITKNWLTYAVKAGDLQPPKPSNFNRTPIAQYRTLGPTARPTRRRLIS